MIRIENLRFAYHGRGEVLRLDAAEFPSGSETLVMGPSGCGKTTLLHLIAGLLVPASGSILVGGTDIGALPPAARDRFRGERIGIVLQQFHLLPSLTALQNLTVAQTMAGKPVDRTAAMELLATLGVAECAGIRPRALSVGQQQRVAIARALVNRPSLLLADEPTSSLDDEACATVAELLLSGARRAGATLVVATHDARLRARVARVVALPRPVAAVSA